MEYKLVLNDPKSAKSYKKEVKDNEAEFFRGKKIGETVKGDNFGLPGYEFVITGGSDHSGFPMRWDVESNTKKKILAVGGVGIKSKRKGMKVRKTVAGNTVGNETVQINLKVTKEGKDKLGESAETEEKKE
ncbi:MAG: 30S ribosomal protein S6e [Candidatus Nanoarchaeia archaeon]